MQFSDKEKVFDLDIGVRVLNLLRRGGRKVF